MYSKKYSGQNIQTNKIPTNNAQIPIKQTRPAKYGIPKPKKTNKIETNYSSTNNFQINNNYIINTSENESLPYTVQTNRYRIPMTGYAITEAIPTSQTERYHKDTIIVYQKKIKKSRIYNNNSVHYIKQNNNNDNNNQDYFNLLDDYHDVYSTENNVAYNPKKIIKRENTPKMSTNDKPRTLRHNYSSKALYRVYETEINYQKEIVPNNDNEIFTSNKTNYTIVNVKHTSHKNLDTFNMTTPNNTRIHTIVCSSKNKNTNNDNKTIPLPQKLFSNTERKVITFGKHVPERNIQREIEEYFFKNRIRYANRQKYINAALLIQTTFREFKKNGKIKFNFIKKYVKFYRAVNLVQNLFKNKKRFWKLIKDKMIAYGKKNNKLSKRKVSRQINKLKDDNTKIGQISKMFDQQNQNTSNEGKILRHQSRDITNINIEEIIKEKEDLQKLLNDVMKENSVLKSMNLNNKDLLSKNLALKEKLDKTEKKTKQLQIEKEQYFSEYSKAKNRYTKIEGEVADVNKKLKITYLKFIIEKKEAKRKKILNKYFKKYKEICQKLVKLEKKNSDSITDSNSSSINTLSSTVKTSTDKYISKKSEEEKKKKEEEEKKIKEEEKKKKKQEELVRKRNKILIELFYNKEKERLRFIHSCFSKFYYKGMIIQYKFRKSVMLDKLRESKVPLKKLEEEKKKKEEEEAKRKKELEEEEKKKKEEIEAEKKKKQLQEQEEEKKRLDKLEEEKDKAKKLENEKLGKEKFNEEKNKFQNEVVQNNIADAMKNQLLFEKKVLEKGFSENEEFFCSCSILDKKWFDKFSKLINYDAIKEEVSKSQNNMDDVITKEIKNKNINLKELSELIKEKPKSINAQALENIENLAFVDDEFAAKILNMDLNSMNNNKNQSNNSINQINIKNEPPAKPIIPKANIAINNGAALIQINNQKCIASNLQNGDLNKRQNNEIINLPSENFNLIETIKKIPPKNKKDGLIYNAKQFVFKEKRPNPAPINQISNQPPLNNMMNINQPFNNNIQVQNNNQDANKKPRINLDNRDESLGLDNVGATCYMNATLQCLAHVKRVTEHILNYRDEGLLKDTSKFRLSEAYSEVVQEIWLPKNKTKKSFPPDRFKKVLGDMNSLFAPMAANDAKDLLIYFIEQMHTELNKSTETNLNLVMPDNMNPMNHQEVLACFVQEFMKKYNSVFSHYFYGSNVSITLCHGCKIQKFSYQCFSFLIFPLLEAKKNCVAIGKLNPMFYNQYILNIEDCFLYNQKIELFNGNNQMYCNMCQASKDASMWTRISAAPLVLILILNRGKGNLDFKEPFIFWELIDLSNYVEFRQPDNKYFLSGVVSHMGDSGPSGHFIAFCRMSQNSKWYCYNDSIVSESSFIEINKRGTPYILFYQKCVMIA